MQHFLILLLPGVLGGMINAIAGGGGIVMYPALLASGLSPLVANATASLVVWPGSITSAIGYREELKKVPRAYFWLLLPCFAGAIIGSYILVHTRPVTFEKLAPWLVLSAVLLLALQSRIHHWLTQQTKKRKLHWHTLPLICLATFPLAIYGGFFGVGFGLMMLALLGFTNLANIYQMNGLKNVCGIIMAVVATIYFMHAGFINFSSGLIMAAGTAVGGYAGSRLSQRISAHFVHDMTITIGLIISLILIVKS
jgi:uncharacterized membrane protein YfcA